MPKYRRVFLVDRNMLNRVIDGTVPVTGDLLQLMDEVVATLPALVAESAGPGIATLMSLHLPNADALCVGASAATPALTGTTQPTGPGEGLQMTNYGTSTRRQS